MYPLYMWSLPSSFQEGSDPIYLKEVDQSAYKETRQVRGKWMKYDKLWYIMTSQRNHHPGVIAWTDLHLLLYSVYFKY